MTVSRFSVLGCCLLLGCLVAARPALAAIDAYPFYNLCDDPFSPATTDAGVIVSHGRFGSEPYPYDTSCTITISVPVGYSVSISITDVDVDYSSAYLYLSDDNGFHFIRSPQTLSLRGDVVVEHLSDEIYNSRGFRLLYQLVQDGNEPEPFPTGRTFGLYRVCGRSYSSEFTRGVLFTHRRYGFEEYSNDEDCAVTLDIAGLLRFNVDAFSLENCCDTLYYTPANGVRTRITSTGFFNAEGPVTFSFHSDFSITDDGVRILYQLDDQVHSYGWYDLEASADNAETPGDDTLPLAVVIALAATGSACVLACICTLCCLYCCSASKSTSSTVRRTVVASSLTGGTGQNSNTSPVIQMQAFSTNTAPPYTPTAEQPPQQQQYPPSQTSYPPQQQQQQYPPSQTSYPPQQQQQQQPTAPLPSDAPVSSTAYPDAPPSYTDVVG